MCEHSDSKFIFIWEKLGIKHKRERQWYLNVKKNNLLISKSEKDQLSASSHLTGPLQAP